MKRAVLLFQFVFLAILNLQAQAWNSQESNTNSNLRSIFFINANYGFAVGTDGVILKTTDGGENWKLKSAETTSDLVAVCFADSLTGFAISNHEVFKTNDGGNNWLLPDTVNHENSKILTNIQFSSPDTGFIAGNGKFLKTTDKGTTWTKLSGSPYFGVSSFYAANKDTLYLGGFGFVVLKSADGGDNWFLSHDYTNYGSFNSLFFTNSSNGFAAGGTFAQGYYYGIIRRTVDGGQNWLSSWHFSSSEGGVSMTAVFFANDSIGYATSSGGQIIKSTDAGASWTVLISGTSLSLNAIFFTDTLTGYVVGNQGTILKTNTGGIDYSFTDNQIESGLKYYPNPVKNELVIETASLVTGTEIAVYTVTGQKLLSAFSGGPKTTVNLSALHSGMYIVRISGNKSYYSFKIVKE